MKDELLKRLKDAGFPVKTHTYHDIDGGVSILVKPTLGEILREIEKTHPPTAARRYYFALHYDGSGKYYMVADYDETHGILTDLYDEPEEAAAELYLRLAKEGGK